MVRKQLWRTALWIQRIMAPGATLNARHELERAASTLTDVDAQLRRVVLPEAPPHAA